MARAGAPQVLPMMKGKRCLVTGATGGIGRAIARGLLEREAEVILVCRDPERGRRLCDQLVAETGNKRAHLMLADLSSQQSILELSQAFSQRFDRLHVLINNAAIVLSQRQESVDGLEMQFAVNHMAPFLLTNLLRGPLEKAAPARIITVASEAHRRAGLAIDDLQSERGYNARTVYQRTKLANLLFTFECARRFPASRVTANCLHPGVFPTELLGRYIGRWATLPPFKWLFPNPAKGAVTPLYLAEAPELKSISGGYFVKCEAVRASELSRDPELACELWRQSERLVKLPDGIPT